MYISKKHISRRTVLRGMGATVALPFLDAMVPARTVGMSKYSTRRPRPYASRFSVNVRTSGVGRFINAVSSSAGAAISVPS